MGQVAQAVTNIVAPVVKVVTNPGKANFGEIAAVVAAPVTAGSSLVALDAVKHPGDRVTDLAIIGTAVGVGAAFAAAGGAGAAGVAGTGTAIIGGAKTGISAAQNVANISAALNPPPGGNQDPPSFIAPPSATLDAGTQGGWGGGVWSTGSGGGSGNVYANPAYGLPPIGSSTMTYVLIGAGLLVVLFAALKKRR